MTESRRLLGVVMDPIESISPAKDSTLAMLLASNKPSLLESMITGVALKTLLFLINEQVW